MWLGHSLHEKSFNVCIGMIWQSSIVASRGRPRRGLQNVKVHLLSNWFSQTMEPCKEGWALLIVTSFSPTAGSCFSLSLSHMYLACTKGCQLSATRIIGCFSLASFSLLLQSWLCHTCVRPYCTEDYLLCCKPIITRFSSFCLLIIILIMCSFLCHFSFGAQGPLHETK